jgi:hypothetical protein
MRAGDERLLGMIEDRRPFPDPERLVSITALGLTRVAGAVPVDPLLDPSLAKNGSGGNFPLN